MNTFSKSLLLAALFAAPMSQISAMQAPAMAAQTLAELAKDPKVQAFIIAMNQAKENANETILGNLSDSAKGLGAGARSLGLGLSRGLLEFSNNFRDGSAMLAKHYWILGSMFGITAWFGIYIYPNLKLTFLKGVNDLRSYMHERNERNVIQEQRR